MNSHVVLLYIQEVCLPRSIFRKSGLDCRVSGYQLWGRRFAFWNRYG